MGVLFGIWNFFQKGGWKLLVIIGLAVGLFFAATTIIKKLEDGAVATQQLHDSLAQQTADNARIIQQNQEILDLGRTTQINTASIGQLRSQLTRIESTITADGDTSSFQNELQDLLNRQYQCLEKISRNETNATCN